MNPNGVVSYANSTSFAMNTAGQWTVTFVSNTNVLMQAWGAGGAVTNSPVNSGMAGGYTMGTVNATAGSSYAVWVGGGGKLSTTSTGQGQPQTFGGGGETGWTNQDSGNLVIGQGGGLSGVFMNNSATFTNALLIAGGGGGGAGSLTGASGIGGYGGGVTGVTGIGSGSGGGPPAYGAIGGGGTQTAGGQFLFNNNGVAVAGVASYLAGSQLAGGAMTNSVSTNIGNLGGASGGGGYWGGGASGPSGNAGGGAGGGSGYVNSAVVLGGYTIGWTALGSGFNPPNYTDVNWTANAGTAFVSPSQVAANISNTGANPGLVVFTAASPYINSQIVNSSTTANTVITLPNGTQAGDMVFVFIPNGSNQGSTPLSLTAGSGSWTANTINTSGTANAFADVHLFYKTVTSADLVANTIQTSYVVNPASASIPIVVSTYRNVGNVAIINANTTSTLNTSLTFVNSPARTSTAVGWLSFVSNKDSNSVIAPIGFTARVAPFNGTTFDVCAADLMGYSHLPSTVGNSVVWTLTGATNPPFGYLIELRT
jgi:hypothetical protein